MKQLFWCAFLIINAVSVNAQTCELELKGQVRDAHTLEAVPFAKLSIAGNQPVQLVADSTGRFRFTGLCQGTIVLQCIPHFGCEPTMLEVNLPLQSDGLILEVETHLIELDEAVVKVYRFRRTTQAVAELETRDISAIHGNTLGEQLSRLPGMSSLNTGSSIVKPVINGMHSNRIVVVNNDIRQEGQQWGSEHAPEIDPNLATKLEVIQGASGLQYGPDAIGGVILVKPEPLAYGKSFNGWLKSSVQSNGKGGMLSGMWNGSFKRMPNFAFRIHGTGRITGTQQSPDYYIRNTASNDYSFSGAVGYRNSRWEAELFYTLYATNLGIFTGSHIGNLTDLNNAFKATQPKDSGYFTYKIYNPKQFVQHQLSRFSLMYDWNERTRTSLIVGYQYNLRQEYDLHKSYNDSIAALGLPAFELNLWTTTADLKTTINHNSKLQSVFGLSGLQQDNAYYGRFFIPNFRKWQAGVFYTGSLNLEKWKLDYGMRMDVSHLQVYMYTDNVLISPQRVFSGVSASFGAMRVLNHHLTTRINVGTAWRPPSINELYSNGLHHGAAAIEVGDSQLRKETVYNGQVGVTYKSRLFKLDFSAFYNYFDGYINLQPVLPPQLTIVGAFPVFHYRQSNSYLAGMNGILEVPVKKWFTYFLQGNYLYAEDLKQHSPVYGIPSNRLVNRIRTEHPLKGEWSWFAEVEGVQVFRQNRVSADADYVAPPAGYFLVNASAGVSKKITKDQSLQLVLDCANLTNRTYRDYMNRFRYFTDDLGRNWTLKLYIPLKFNSKKQDYE